jgi:hypothetical protein
METMMKENTLESLPRTAAVEIAVVECDPDAGEKYNAKRLEMLALLQEQPGFIGWRGFESQTRPGVMLDILYWENPENCHAAGAAMQCIPEAREFFAMMKQTLLFETFRRQM